MDLIPSKAVQALESLGIVLKDTNTTWKLGDNGRCVTLEIKWSTNSQKPKPSPIVKSQVRTTGTQGCRTPENSAPRIVVPKQRPRRRRNRGPSERLRNRQRLLDYQRQHLEALQNHGAQGSAYARNTVTSPSEDRAVHVMGRRISFPTVHFKDESKLPVLYYSTAAQYSPPSSPGQDISGSRRPVSPRLSPNPAGEAATAGSGSIYKIVVEAGSAARKVLHPDVHEKYTLNVPPGYTVGLLLEAIAGLTGIQQPLVLQDYIGGHCWTLSSNRLIGDILTASDNSSFVFELEL
jgi:hypothetical protein